MIYHKRLSFIGKIIGKYQLIQITFTNTNTDYQISNHTDTLPIQIIKS